MKPFSRLFFVFLFCLGTSLQAASFNQLVVFGDSLSDQGNLFQLSFGTNPDPAHYFNGRSSNGPVYAERLASRYGLPLNHSLAGGTNFAVRGARTGSHPLTNVLGMRGQVDSYLGLTLNTTNPNALYIVWAGGNDIDDILVGGADPATTINNAITDIATAVGQLRTAGAQHILVANLPNIGLTPDARAFGPQGIAAAQQLSQTFNAGLHTALAGTGVYEFDVYSLLNGVVANPSAYGLNNVTDACYDRVATECPDPENYLFWDGFHPTAAGHQVIADAMHDQLAAVPEPETWLLLAISLLLLGSYRKRISQQ